MRLWELKPLLRDCKTYIFDKTEALASETDIPAGFKYIPFASSVPNDALLRSTRTEMESMFANLRKYQAAMNVEGVKISQQDNITSWPCWDNAFITKRTMRRHLEANKCYLPVNTAYMLGFLKSHQYDSTLALFKHHYDNVIARIHNARHTQTMSREELESHINQHSSLHIMKYEANEGMVQHIDNLLRSDSTILTIGLARKVVYDLSPVLHSEHPLRGKILRATLPEGSAVILNDDVRFHWTHGIPEHEDGSIKYTLIWKLMHTPEMIQNNMETHKFSMQLARPMYSLRLD